MNQRKRVGIALGILLVGAVIGGLVIFRGRPIVAPNLPPTLPPPDDGLVLPGPQGENIEPAELGDEESILNGVFQAIFSEHEQVISSGEIRLKDGKASFVPIYCMDPKRVDCETTHRLVVHDVVVAPIVNLGYEARMGIAVVEHLPPGAPPRLYVGTLEAYASKGASGTVFNTAGTLPSDFVLQEVTLGADRLVTVAGKRGSDRIVYRYIVDSVRHGGWVLIEATADGASKRYRDSGEGSLGFEFTYPKEFRYSYGYHYGYSGRALAIEYATGYKPVYFAEACGLAPTFADRRAAFGYGVRDGGPPLDLAVAVHRRDAATVYLTTAYYGYDPSEWGTVKDGVAVGSFVRELLEGADIGNHDAELLTIAGLPVRHVLPYTEGRPCDPSRFEQYQWIAGDFIVSIILTEEREKPFDAEKKRAIAEEVIKSFRVSTGL